VHRSNDNAAPEGKLLLISTVPARKWRIYETGIHYYGRTYREGKKINWKDGLKALWYLISFRINPGN
jgi:hypothetical protein